MAVALTNPQKLLWPEAGVSKEDLRAYFEAFGELIVEHVRQRPLTVVRAPDGVGGFTFFQKQTPDYAPAWIDTVTLDSPASKRRRVRYTVCNDVDTLLWLANQAAVELHPALSRIDKLERPDALVLDLDPPEGRFDLAVEAARALAAACERAGVRAMLKTTGGKGLHLYAPIERRYDFEQVERAATALAREAMEREPSLLTLAFRKAERRGRVLVDVGRNSPGATMVAAFSPRARPAATVSFPVTWDALERTDPGRFTIKSVMTKLDDPAIEQWRASRREPQRLPRALVSA